MRMVNDTQRGRCYLGGFEQYAYPELPQEVQLIWYYDIEAQ